MKTSHTLAFFAIALVICLNTYGVASKREIDPTPSMNCIPPVDKWIIFDLRDIKNNEHNYNVTLDDGSWIEWNLCNFTANVCNGVNSYAVKWTPQPEGPPTCTHLTAASTTSNISVTLLQKDTPKSGVSVQFTGGDVSGTDQYSFTLNLACSNETMKNTSKVISPFSFALNYDTKYGCPKVNPNELWNLIVGNPTYAAIVGLILGSLLLFVGYRLSKAAFFFFGFAVSFVPIMYFFYAYTAGDVKKNETYAVWGIAAVIGILFGIIAVRLEKIGYFIIGFTLSWAVSSFVFTTFFSTLEFGTYILYGSIVIGGIIVGLLMAQFKDAILMLTTSIVGSYLIARPMFQLFDKKFPNEFQIADMIKIGELKTVPWEIYAYLATWLILAVCGLYFQISKKREDRKKTEEPPAYLRI